MDSRVAMLQCIVGEGRVCLCGAAWGNHSPQPQKALPTCLQRPHQGHNLPFTVTQNAPAVMLKAISRPKKEPFLPWAGGGWGWSSANGHLDNFHTPVNVPLDEKQYIQSAKPRHQASSASTYFFDPCSFPILLFLILYSLSSITSSFVPPPCRLLNGSRWRLLTS